MKRIRVHLGRSGTVGVLVAGAFLAAGCNDFTQHRLSGVRSSISEPRPTPAPALAISNGPSTSRPRNDQTITPASYPSPRETVPIAASEPVASPQQHPIRTLYERAAQRHAAMDAYSFRLKRREVVGANKQPEELIQVKLRREPFSVHLTWLSKEGKGRETIYVAGKFENKMQVLLAPGDPFAFLMGGKWMAVATDDSMVKAKSRYPITTTGFGSIIERFGEMLAGIESGNPRDGTVKYLGQVKRDEFVQKVEAVYQVLPPQADPRLPKGGERWWFFDASHGLPVLLISHDPSGEVEYYCHDQIQHPIRIDDEDFNPVRRK